MALSKAARGALGVILIFASTGFMSTAWYLHLKFESWSIAQAIFISWGIALPEYCLQVPANRLSSDRFGGPFTSPQLKVIAEGCSLTTFALFSTFVLKEKLRWADLGAFALILSGVLLSLLTKPPSKVESPPLPPPKPEPLPSPSIEGAPPKAEVQVVVGRKMLVNAADGITDAGGGGVGLSTEPRADNDSGPKGAILSTN